MNAINDLWNFRLLSIGDRNIFVSNLLTALFCFGLGLLLAKLISRYLHRLLVSKFNFHDGAAVAIHLLVYYFLAFGFLLFSLNIANIPLTVFTVLGGALAIGVGFGSQNIVNNFISGLILLTERPVRVGDVVEVEGTRGIVRKIGARSTQVRSYDNVDIIIPNSSFLEKNVVNWTLGDDTVRSKVSVGVLYGSPVERVRELLLEATASHEKVLKDPKPFVLFRDFGDNALIFEAYFWASLKGDVLLLRIESDLRFVIDRLFRENKIVIAFPQRDVHLDTAHPIEVKVVGPLSSS